MPLYPRSFISSYGSIDQHWKPRRKYISRLISMMVWRLCFPRATACENILFKSSRISIILQTFGVSSAFEVFTPSRAASKALNRSGRWRSEYTIDFDEGKVTGRILVHVHYYEQGNVCWVYPVIIGSYFDDITGAVNNDARHFFQFASWNLYR